MKSRYLLSAGFAVCLGLWAPAAAAETPLEIARRLAASEKRDERVQALQQLKALGRPGTAGGDEALFCYAELCLCFHAEGERNALTEAKRAFAELKEKSGSRWGLRGEIGLHRLAAVDGRRDEAIKGLDRFLAQQTKCERAVEAKRQGDVHGRIDHESLGESLREGARCLRRLGREREAERWDGEASNLPS